MVDIVPPRRGEFFTPAGVPTPRFIQWIESLTTQSNEIVNEVSETSELISGSSTVDEVAQELEIDMAMLSSSGSGVNELMVISASGDYTTTGSQIVVCTNTSDIVVTLNSTPDDTEQVHIIRQNTGGVTVNGNINGGTSLTIGQRYSSPHLIYTTDAAEWSII